MSATLEEDAPARRGPSIILAEPQLGENVGTAIRAMANFGLSDLRLVNPRQGWPNAKAQSAASGAHAVIAAVRVFTTLEEALGDLNYVFALTARSRDMVKPLAGPGQAAAICAQRMSRGERVGFVFGQERCGLTNDQVALCDAVLTLPANPDFSSLNLAQAVLLVGYEWFAPGARAVETDRTPGVALRVPLGDTAPATKAELAGFFAHLEGALDASGFLKPVEKRPAMVRSIRNMFQRTSLTGQDVRTLRGIVSSLVRQHQRPKG